MAVAMELPVFPDGGANPHVARYLREIPDPAGLTVVDVPCGDGKASYLLHSRGARVLAFDLFPEFMRAPGVEAVYADMNGRLPVPDNTADIVICQEGIEHVPNQLALLGEFNRILKPGGRLLLTTPSLSHARARLSWLLMESDSWRRMPPTVLDSVWVSDAVAGRTYYGHLFLRGVQHLDSLLDITGFRVIERRATDSGISQWLLGLLMYPFLVLGSLASFFTYARKRRGQIPGPVGRPVWWRQVCLNLAPVTVFCKHVFWVAERIESPTERVSRIPGLLAGRVVMRPPGI